MWFRQKMDISLSYTLKELWNLEGSIDQRGM